MTLPDSLGVTPLPDDDHIPPHPHAPAIRPKRPRTGEFTCYITWRLFGTLNDYSGIYDCNLPE